MSLNFLRGSLVLAVVVLGCETDDDSGYETFGYCYGEGADTVTSTPFPGCTIEHFDYQTASVECPTVTLNDGACPGLGNPQFEGEYVCGPKDEFPEGAGGMGGASGDGGGGGGEPAMGQCCYAVVTGRRC